VLENNITPTFRQFHRGSNFNKT